MYLARCKNCCVCVCGGGGGVSIPGPPKMEPYTLPLGTRALRGAALTYPSSTSSLPGVPLASDPE